MVIHNFKSISRTCILCSHDRCLVQWKYSGIARWPLTVRPGLKGPPSSRPFHVILIGLRKISRNFSNFHILTSQQFLETVSRFFAQTVRSYVCNIVLHPLLMAYVVEICDNYADLSCKVLLPMYIMRTTSLGQPQAKIDTWRS